MEWREESIHQKVTKGRLDGAARVVFLKLGGGFTGTHSSLCFTPCMQSHSVMYLFLIQKTVINIFTLFLFLLKFY